MKYVEVIFSPTGGVKKAASLLSASWGEPERVVDLSERGGDLASAQFGPDVLALFALPSFGGRVPGIAAERMAELKGDGAPCVLLCVYGNRAFEDTLAEMEDLARAAGFRPVAAVAAVAEHSIVRQIAAGRPDARDASELESMGREIMERARSGEAPSRAIPGDRPYRKPGSVPVVPKASKDCSKCGTCARECPAGAIDPDNPSRTHKDACITCMRCVAVCPRGARSLNGAALALVASRLKKVCSDRKANELFL